MYEGPLAATAPQWCSCLAPAKVALIHWYIFQWKSDLLRLVVKVVPG